MNACEGNSGLFEKDGGSSSQHRYLGGQFKWQGGMVLRRFFLRLYMMRIPLSILFVLGAVLPLTFGSPMFHGLADLEPKQIWMVSLASFLLVSAAITSAFLVLLYGRDRADGQRLPVGPPLAQAALSNRLPLSGWVVGLLYMGAAVAFWRFLNAILQTMKMAHPNPTGLSSLFWHRVLWGVLAGSVIIVVVFLSEIWLSDPRQAPQVEVFALPIVYLFRDSGWLRSILKRLSNAQPAGKLRQSRFFLGLKRLRLFFVWIVGPGYGQFNDQGRAVELSPGHGFAAMLAAVCVALYLMAGAGEHQRLSTDDPFGPARMYDAVILQVILLLLLACWLLSGLSFFFDRFRILVLLPIVVWLGVTSHLGTSDHVFHTSNRPAQAPAIPNPQTKLAGAPDHIIAIAAAGGGIQAAAWTSQVLCGLRQDLGEAFDRSVLVISGVSGGSIGAMFYLRCLESPPGSTAAAEAATKSSLEAIAWGLAHPDLRHAVLPVQGWWWPGDDRGWALERAIRKNAQFLPRDRPLASQSAVGDWPVLLFNSTEARTGDPFVFTNSDFPAQNGSSPANHQLHNFHQVHSGRDVRVETAARMSAAFPYVSPAARADTPWNAEHLVDGGYFENSGLFSLREWLKEAAVSTKAEDNARQRHPPKKILIIQIDAFPDRFWNGPADQPKSWAYQLLAPVLAILHVRSEGALVRDTAEQSDLLELLSERGYDASAVTARYVPSVGSKNSTLAVTCPADPPLTWHLTEVEKICIRQNWTDIESTLATKVKEFLGSPVSSPDFTKPRSIRSEHVKEGLYLHQVIR
jgi:predicted acylesterase/phospholipase RssA